MKILQLISSSRVSGAEKHVLVLSERLIALGHEVVSIVPSGGWLPDQLRAANIPVFEMNMRGISALSVPWRLSDFVRENVVDLIHTHLTRATYYGWAAGQMTKRPVVSSLHTRTHDLIYTKLLPRSNNKIITVSNFLRDMLLSQGTPAKSLRTIYNGTEFFKEDGEEKGRGKREEGRVDNETRDVLENFSIRIGRDVSSTNSLPSSLFPLPSSLLPLRAELNLPPDAQLVGVFGHVGAQKGQALLVQAAHSIVNRCPKAYFIFVGPAEPKIQKQLWEMASADGVSDRLRYMGFRNDVPQLMDEMDIIAVPSTIESCPMVVIEAMARGKPVIGARVGGIPELIEHEMTGLMVDRIPIQLADAVVMLLQDPERRILMGKSGRESVRKHFSARIMVTNIEALYNEVLKAQLTI